MVLILLNTVKKIINLHVNKGTFWQSPNCPATSSDARNYNKHFHTSSERTKALFLLKNQNTTHANKQTSKQKIINYLQYFYMLLPILLYFIYVIIYNILFYIIFYIIIFNVLEVASSSQNKQKLKVNNPPFANCHFVGLYNEKE